MRTDGRSVVAWMAMMAALASLMTLCVGQTCRYRYIEQPIVNLRCHPYDSGRLFTECAVTRGNGEEPINIEWVFQSADSVFSGSLSSSSMITITESFSTSLTQRSQLRIASPNDNNAGEYSCQIRFDNGTFAPASRALQLPPREVFDAQRLSPCLLTYASTVIECGGLRPTEVPVYW